MCDKNLKIHIVILRELVRPKNLVIQKEIFPFLRKLNMTKAKIVILSEVS